MNTCRILSLGLSALLTAMPAVADTTPDAFSFTDQTDVALSTTMVSNSITVSGIDSPAEISVNGGTYSINGGVFTAAAGTVTNDQTVLVRHISATSFSTTTNTVLTIGGISDTFSATTQAKDTTPDAFSFTDQTNVTRSTVMISNGITVAGINSPVAISVSGGTFAIDGGSFSSTARTVSNGQTVQVRHTSSSSFFATTNTVLTIGGISDTFSATTQAKDTTPDAFSFTDRTGVLRSTSIISNSITVSGINSAAAISITGGGTYSIGTGSFTSTAGTVSNGQTVRVRRTSSASFGATTDTVLTIGGVSDTFSVTTLTDATPDAFSFTDQTGVARSTAITSDGITVAGIDGPVAISVSGGTFAIDGGSFSSTARTVSNGQTVQVRHTSSSSFSATTNTVLTIGGISDTFSATTQAKDTTPDAFSFTDRTGVLRSTSIISNSITVSGINSAAAISITGGGTYSIGSGSFTSAAGTVSNGQTVRVRRTSASTLNTTADAVLTIGWVSDTFSVTTLTDATPDAFSFTDQTGVARSTAVTSDSITVAGIDGPVAISVSGGTFAIDGGSFSSTARTVSNGQTVQVRHTSSSSFSTTTNSVLTIGGVSDTFISTTQAKDTTPDAFSFTDQTGVLRSTAITSNSITVSGINSGASISITGGTYSIGTGSFTSTAGTVSNGQIVRVRRTSSASFGATTDTVLTIGGVSDTFSVTTLTDATPDAFSFTDQTGVARSTAITSDGITVAGIDGPVAISVTGGTYSINGGSFSSTARTVSNGQTVQVRHTSSSSFSATTNTVLTIGGISDTFSTTTLAKDTTPDAFSFTDQMGVLRSTAITSNSITVSGINSAAAISVTGGTYSIGTGSFTSTAGTVSNGQTVRVRRTSSSSLSTTTDVVLTIGGVSDTFSVTTLTDATPDAFSFTDQTGVARSTAVTSDSITVAGIDGPVAISVTGGTYSINGGAFTSTAGTVTNGQTVQVRHTSSASFSTTTNTVLTIGGVNDTFSTTTLTKDTTPDAFSFTDQSGVLRSTVVTSDSITVTGINSAASISVTGGTYSIGTGSFTSTAGTVSNGQTVRVRKTASSSFSTTIDVVLTIGGVSDTFSVTTGLADTMPNAFSFTDQTGIALDTAVTSNSITVAGIDSPAPISVIDGTYSINSGSFTAVAGTVTNGQTVRVRQTSSSSFSTTTNTVLTIGGVSDTFSVTTLADTIPDAFSFIDQADVALSTATTSNSITVAGIDGPAAISVIGGTYSINSGAFTAVAGTVTNGQTVRVQHTSSANFSTTTNTVLTIGGVSDTFSSTTQALDTTPDTFSFTDQTGVARSTAITSNSITVAGINNPATISVTGGTYSINGGAFTAVAGTVTNGQTVQVGHTSSASFSTPTDTVLTIDSISDTFSSTTQALDTTPDAFSFTDQTGVARSTTITSNSITVAGINNPATISVTGGTYSINGGLSFTSIAGTVTNGQTVLVRHTSSASFSTTTNTVLTIGGVSDTFSSTTQALDTTPDAFSFTDQTGVARSTEITSNSITVTGINSAATVSVTGGTYSINSGSFTSAGGTVTNGQTVRVRHTSSSSFSTTTNTVLTIGGVSDTFSVTTLAPDTTPDAFSFTDQTGVAQSTVATSNSITVAGMEAAASISVTGGTYSINSGSFTAVAGTVTNGQTVRVRQTSASTLGTMTDAVLTIGGISDTFSVTTLTDATPDAFSFTDQTDVAPGALITSNEVTIFGIDGPVPVTVSGSGLRAYSINGGDFTSASGLISNGQTLRLQLESSSSFLTSKTMTLNVGDRTATFTVITAAADTTPDAFGFPDIMDADPGEIVVLPEFQITGINDSVDVWVTGGEVRLLGTTEEFSGSTSASNLDSIEIRVVAPLSHASIKTATITIGGTRSASVSDTFTISTAAADITPDSLVFNSQTDVPLGSYAVSDSVAIGGIDGPAKISVIRGQYSIDGGSFTNEPGVINNGQSVVLRQLASFEYATTVSAALTVGNTSGTFSVTTLDNPFPEAPLATVKFPPPSALTDADSITVTGSAEDPDSIEAVRVNGVAATTTDGFANWRATVPLNAGTNSIVVETEDSLANINPAAAQTRVMKQVPVTFNPARIIADETSAYTYMGTSIVEIDLATGDRWILSGSGIGSGDAFVQIRDLALDSMHNRLLVLDSSLHAVIGVDLDTGDRTVVSSDTVGAGTATFSGSSSLLASDNTGDFAYVYDDILSALIKVDLTTGETAGNRTIVSSNTGPGTGTSFFAPQGLAVDPVNDRAFLSQNTSGFNTIIRVTLSTGNRTQISSQTSGSMSGIVVDTANARILAADYNLRALVAINITSGSRTIISDDSTGAGWQFSGGLGPVADVALDSANSRLLFADFSRGIFAIDPASGDRELLSGNRVGAGTVFPKEFIEFDSANNRLLLLVASNLLSLTPTEASIHAIDLATGDRTLISGTEAGLGPNFSSVTGFEYLEDEATAFVLDPAHTGMAAVFAVDTATGNRTIVANSSTGSGLSFSPQTRGIAFHQATDRIIAIDRRSSGVVPTGVAVLSIDPANGNRTILSGQGVGSGTAFSAPARLTIDQAAGGLGFVTDTSLDSILSVNLSSGDRMIVSSNSVGTGPSLGNPNDVNFDVESGDLWLTDSTLKALLTVDTETGNRIIISDLSIGTGPLFVTPVEVEHDFLNDLLFVSDSGLSAIFAVEPISGDRVMISK